MDTSSPRNFNVGVLSIFRPFLLTCIGPKFIFCKENKLLVPMSILFKSSPIITLFFDNIMDSSKRIFLSAFCLYLPFVFYGPNDLY